ncbi:MAG: preprotein translocase subunit SecE [Patescibacteria group bacterium]
MNKGSINPTIFKGIADEVKKVEWPSRKDALHLTLVVVIISVLVGLYTGVLDIALAKLLQIVLSLKK